MNRSFDTTFDFRDFSNEQLLASSIKAGELLKGLPERDGYHRDLATDLAGQSSLLGRILGKDPRNEFSILKRELDDERDALYTGLAQSIRSAQRNPLPAKATAAKELSALLDRRRVSLHRLSDDENTAELTLLFADLDTKAAQANLATLDLGNWYTKLQAVNREFEEAVLEEGQGALNDEEQLPPLTQVKQHLGFILRLLLQGIAYQAGQQRSPYVELATQLDQALAAIRTVSLRRTTRKAKAKKNAALNA
jgi:hypothetical protein